MLWSQQGAAQSTRAFQSRHCCRMHPNTAGPGMSWGPGSYNNMLLLCPAPAEQADSTRGMLGSRLQIAWQLW